MGWWAGRVLGQVAAPHFQLKEVFLEGKQLARQQVEPVAGAPAKARKAGSGHGMLGGGASKLVLADCVTDDLRLCSMDQKVGGSLG